MLMMETVVAEFYETEVHGESVMIKKCPKIVDESMR